MPCDIRNAPLFLIGLVGGVMLFLLFKAYCPNGPPVPVKVEQTVIPDGIEYVKLKDNPRYMGSVGDRPRWRDN